MPAGREPASGRRTRNPVNSLETLIQKPRRPAGEPAGEPARETAGETLLLGRYRLLERLGAGGFGVVWRAEDVPLHREVALKRIPLAPDVLQRGGAGEARVVGEETTRQVLRPRTWEPHPSARAGREALASARLSHPAIVALFEAHEDADAFYLVSELVRGDTLAGLIAREELSDERALEIGLALTQALAHAHARGVIHRDIKPQNVLVPDARDARQAPAKLADFGGAQLAGEDALTRTGETLGTLAYMAPEQSEGREASEAVDVYSLALVVYEALTGVNPVRGPTPAATARRVGCPLPPLAERRPDLAPVLTETLDRALAVDPGRRAPLEDLRVAFEEALADAGSAPRGPSRRRVRAPTARGPAAAPPQVARALAPVAPVAAVPGESESKGAADETVPRGRGRGLALPRGVWLGGALALALWQAIEGRPGVALLALVALAPPLLLLGRRPGAGWLAGALAPLLGVAGLAGAYPACAGQGARWPARAALGALGYWWLALAEPLLAPAVGGGGGLWLGAPAGAPARAVWEGSLSSAATHVVAPLLGLGVLCGALLWALAAASLPWLVRGSSVALDLFGALAWSAALALATPRAVLAGGASAASATSATTMAHPRGLVLGAILGGAVAIAARALRGPVRARHP